MHIDNDDLIKFENGTMEEDELIEFLSHLDRCDFCLEQMMTQESTLLLLLLPLIWLIRSWEKLTPEKFSLQKQLIKHPIKSSFSITDYRQPPELPLHCFCCSVFRKLIFPLRHLPIPCRQTGLRRTVKAVGFIILPEISDKASVMEPALWLSI